MKRLFGSLSAAILVLALAIPSLAHAAPSHMRAARQARLTHQLPTSSASARVFSFGVKGGSLRPWSVVLALDGSVTATGVDATIHTLTTPQDTLKGLLAALKTLDSEELVANGTQLAPVLEEVQKAIDVRLRMIAVAAE